MTNKPSSDTPICDKEEFEAELSGDDAERLNNGHYLIACVKLEIAQRLERDRAMLFEALWKIAGREMAESPYDYKSLCESYETVAQEVLAEVERPI